MQKTTQLKKQQPKRTAKKPQQQKGAAKRKIATTTKKSSNKKQQKQSIATTTTTPSTSTKRTFSAAAKNQQDGQQFYQAQKATGNYTEAPEGFLYRFLSNGGKSFGTGPQLTPRSTVTVHYEGKLINNSVFDSSYGGEPISFALNQVISGWGLAVMKMSPNDVLECILPSNLAYGPQGTPGGPIGPNSTLIFKIELMEDPGVKALVEGQKFYTAKKASGEYLEHPQGFLYKYTGPKNAGNKSVGGTRPSPNQTVEVDYEGTLISGKVFDSSYRRGQSISFPLNRVIKGWTVAVSELMAVGDKIHVILPPNMAYGAQGAGASIGPNETLQFDIELHKIK